jgi:zinc/manganese transport system permease protein
MERWMPSSELIEIVGPAFAAGLIIALAHVPLGIEVLRRGIIFIDLAVAQIAGLGLVVTGVLWHTADSWQAQLMALAFAMLAGLFFRFAERSLPDQLEAIIGCSFVLSASLALLLLADEPHGGEEVQHLLSGQILFVTWSDFLRHAPVYAAILLFWFLWPSVRSGIWFYILFSLAITSSVQLVGVYVVFASLILPALASVHAARALLTGWLCGTLAIVSGIGFSTWLDLPAGPFMVITYTLACLMILTGRRVFTHPVDSAAETPESASQ